MKVIFYFLIFLFVTLEGCSKRPIKGDFTLIESPKENVRIILDSLTPNYTIPEGCFYKNIDGKNTLVYFNRLNYSLNFFDLNTCKILHQIQYKKQGIYPVNHIGGIEVVNKDSIFLLPMYIKRLYLSDWKGTIKHVFNLHSNPNIDKQWMNEPSGPIDMIDKKCIMATTPLGNQNKPDKYFKIPLGAIWDLQSRKITVNFIHYPELYQQGRKWGFYHAQASQCINEDGDIIMSYGIDPNVYLYRNQRLIKVVNTPCSAFDEGIEEFENIGEEEIYCYNQDKYEYMLYDKYRKVYYRFATKGMDGKEPKESKMLYKGLFKPLYLIILDKRLNKVGEVKLPDNKHYFLNSFITSNGLYISNSHPNNYENAETALTFSCYKLLKNEDM